ncbi:TetR/AcrR family transcriptional regulator [Cellulomonas sp. P22]|uniref:TetR/AcrR family transcriptional regulator n=1 Tax=Cellulomonas sp. P22 TaxID=3373189 RepID=UPI0037B7A3B0
MTTTRPRTDAARNWQRIVEVGREHVDAGRAIQLNEIARAASVGVATVYRHFPGPGALMETLAQPGMADLIERGERAMTGQDPAGALEEFLLDALQAQAADPALAQVFAASQHDLPATTQSAQRLVGLLGELLSRAHGIGEVDPDVTLADLVPLVCGVVHAATLRTTDTADRAAAVRLYLAVVMQGLRPVTS